MHKGSKEVHIPDTPICMLNIIREPGCEANFEHVGALTGMIETDDSDFDAFIDLEEQTPII